MAEFVLMNKDTEVMIVQQNEDSFKFQGLVKVLSAEYLPFSVFCVINREESIILQKLNDWFSMRAIPDYRDNLDELFENCGIKSNSELANKHYALSLSDQYWLKPIGSDVMWRDINYFENEYNSRDFFDATYGVGSFQSLSLHNIRSDRFHTPNNTLGGQLKKTWVQIEKRNFLFKSSSSLHHLEPINEVIASKICEILEVPHVDYELKRVHSKRQDSLVSVCECMINENQEFIPAYELLSNMANLSHTPDDYIRYLNLLKEHRIENAEEYLQKMFMLDYIMLNEDRHLGNFGIIRNVKTLKWESICPIFDTGRSNNTNVSENYWDFETGEVKCFSDNFISSEILPRFFNIVLSERQFDDLRKVPNDFVEMLKAHQSSLKLFDEQIVKLKDGLKNRIEKFYKIMLAKELISN